jgi:hypothetical protein
LIKFFNLIFRLRIPLSGQEDQVISNPHILDGSGRLCPVSSRTNPMPITGAGPVGGAYVSRYQLSITLMRANSRKEVRAYIEPK